MSGPLGKALALIPARGGSKGVPDKNLRTLGGVSLTALAVRCAKQTGLFDRIVVSTDSERIAGEGLAEGAEVLHRPSELASDTADVVDVVAHTLDLLGQEGFLPDILALLEPSCPLRTPAMVSAAVAVLEAADAAFTVTEVPLRFHARKQFLLAADGRARPALDHSGAAPVRRQELSPTYIRNGAAYAFRASMFAAQRSVLGPNPVALPIHEVLVNIDTLEDLAEAVRLFDQRAPV